MPKVELVRADWQVLVLKADRIYGVALQRGVECALPGAVVRITCGIVEARTALKERPVDLLLSGFNVTGGDVLPLLCAGVMDRGWRRALIVTGRKEERVLALLQAAPIAGVFDPDKEDLTRLVAVLPAVVVGGSYWSPSVLMHLRRLRTDADALCRRLTLVEMLVFSAVGDGSDDATAAARLGMKPSSVQSVRSSLHEKLGVQHRGELMRLAVQKGVVHITAQGVHRPGFDSLLASHCERRRGSSMPFPGKPTVERSDLGTGSSLSIP